MAPLVQVPLIKAIHFSLAYLLSPVADVNGTGVACGRGGASLRFCNLLSRMLQCQWNVKHLSKSLNLLLDNWCDREDGSAVEQRCCSKGKTKSSLWAQKCINPLCFSSRKRTTFCPSVWKRVLQSIYWMCLRNYVEQIPQTLNFMHQCRNVQSQNEQIYGRYWVIFKALIIQIKFY